MSGRFDDQCGITDCRFNEIDKETQIRKCKCLSDTDFGGKDGGEHCNFYKPKKDNKKKKPLTV